MKRIISYKCVSLKYIETTTMLYLLKQNSATTMATMMSRPAAPAPAPIATGK